MKRIVAFYILLIMLMLPPDYGWAQLLPIKTFNVQDGLPQSQVTTILQDTLGYLWVGTEDGLARFDGIRFENFNSHNGLTGNRVTVSYEDGDSLIWFGLGRSGISIYRIHSGRFQKFGLNHLLFGYRITSIRRDFNGVIWIGTDQHGLFRYDGKSNFVLSSKNGMPDDHISSITLGPDSSIWVATWQGIVIFNPKKFNRPNTFQYVSSKNGLPANEIENILFFKKHTVWLGTRYNGLIRAKWNRNASRILSDFKIFNKKNHLPDNWIRTLTYDHSGKIWVGTAKGAVQILRPLAKTQRFFTMTTQNGIGHNTIDVIYEDREHILWIGTWGGGLSRYKGKYFETFTTKQGLPNNSVWGIYEDSLHTIWIGTEKGLVGYRDNLKLDKLTPRYIFTKRNGLPFDFILSIEGDGHNGLWLGGWGGGLAYIQPYKRKFRHYTTKDGLPSDFVVSIKRDSKGNFWLATLDHGISYFNPKTGTFKNYNKQNGFPSNKINFIYKDKEGNFWFLTKDQGVVRYNGKSFMQFSGPEKKLNCGVTCMFEDDNHNFWFGTPSDGVLVIRKGIGLIKHITQADGIGGDNIFILAPDPNKHVWIGTKRGVDRFDLRDSTFKHYGFSDGFLCLEPDQNVYLKIVRGTFGSVA